MPFRIINEVLKTNIGTRQKVFEYQNHTKRRLFVNEFTLSPDVYFAHVGRVEVCVNGIPAFDNIIMQTDRISNPLKQFKSYPIPDLFPYLLQGDIIEIFMWDSESMTAQEIKLGIYLNLDFQPADSTAILLEFDPLALAQISITKSIIANESLIAAAKRSGELDTTGYSKIILRTRSSGATGARILSNKSVTPAVITQLSGVFMGTDDLSARIRERAGADRPALGPGPLRPYGRYSIGPFAHSHWNNFHLYNADGTRFDPSGITIADYDADIMDIDTGNSGSDTYDYTIIGFSDQSALIHRTFEHIYEFYMTEAVTSNHQGNNFWRQTWTGEFYVYNHLERVATTVGSQDIIFEGSNNEEFPPAETHELTKIENYESTLPRQNRFRQTVRTAFRYIRVRKRAKNITLAVTTAPVTRTLFHTERAYRSNVRLPDRSEPDVWSLRPSNGRWISTLNELRALPSTVTAFLAPKRLNTWIEMSTWWKDRVKLWHIQDASRHHTDGFEGTYRAGVSGGPRNTAGTITVKIQLKNNDGSYTDFQTLDAITIGTDTDVQISEFISSIIFPKGQDAVRIEAQVSAECTLNIDAILSN